ncbi:hypothetical protein ACFONG_19900 [Uliginosibacterium paludis]|uniref:GDP-L-fucose synthase n=1 Tax=Uliginosibacterium paludis TaxID=1615952 RepID=A0ABV2CUX6_9RHOO
MKRTTNPNSEAMRHDVDAGIANTSPMCSHINVGFGSGVTIREVAEMVAKVVGYKGAIEFDATKPDGTPRKIMDSSRLNALGWKAAVELEAGISSAFKAYLA